MGGPTRSFYSLQHSSWGCAWDTEAIHRVKVVIPEEIYKYIYVIMLLKQRTNKYGTIKAWADSEFDYDRNGQRN